MAVGPEGALLPSDISGLSVISGCPVPVMVRVNFPCCTEDFLHIGNSSPTYVFALYTRPEDEPIHSARRQWNMIGLGKRILELTFENVESELSLTHLSEDV